VPEKQNPHGASRAGFFIPLGQPSDLLAHQFA
jgi:hypothetical protein